jgi:RNA polymerase sigma-54 factor
MPLQSLSLAQQQRQLMILAPQLRQSLEMLQLPIQELRAMIQQEMESNPTIEDVISSQEVSVDAEAPAGTKEEREEPLDFDKEIEALAELDREWRDYFLQDLQNNPYTSDDEERRQYMLDSIQQPVSLQTHLLEQLGLAELPEPDRQLGETLIGSIDDDGYLTISVEELATQTATPAEHIRDVLETVQDFHPTGVGARDLKECLLLQLDRLGDAPEVRLAQTIVTNHLDELGAHKIQQIAKALNVRPEEVEDSAGLIRALDPKPGRLFTRDTAGYVVPEIHVKRMNGRFVVLVDDDQLPHIRISTHYRRLLEDPQTTAEVKSYIRERIRSGAFLIKSIHQRQKTIHRIASEIVNAQQEFLEHGISRLRPMTMAEVASRVGVHETTVSRTVANKYMKTPVGVFEMKYFFSPGLRTATGEAVSNKTVQDKIAGLVQREDAANPLSDQAIQEILQQQGIVIARRTVAKYRMALRIAPSHRRKRV